MMLMRPTLLVFYSPWSWGLGVRISARAWNLILGPFEFQLIPIPTQAVSFEIKRWEIPLASGETSYAIWKRLPTWLR